MLLLLLGLAYLLGSVSSAIIVCRIMQLPDPRSEGSKNPGATNVLRLGGKKAALITLLGDSLKGFIPVLIGHFLHFNVTDLSFIAFFAFIGHLYPVFFGFQGGKGVATYIGALLGLNAFIALAWGALWFVTAKLFKYSSLAALVASILTPFIFWLATGNVFASFIWGVMSGFLIVRHQENIKKLMAGTEGKIGGR